MANIDTFKINVDTDEAEAKLKRLERLTSKAHGRSGWHSTKLHLALIGMAMVTAVFVFVVLVTHSGAGFGEYAITMVSLAVGFQGSRVAETFAQRRSDPEQPTKEAINVDTRIAAAE